MHGDGLVVGPIARPPAGGTGGRRPPGCGGRRRPEPSAVGRRAQDRGTWVRPTPIRAAAKRARTLRHAAAASDCG